MTPSSQKLLFKVFVRFITRLIVREWWQHSVNLWLIYLTFLFAIFYIFIICNLYCSQKNHLKSVMVNRFKKFFIMFDTNKLPIHLRNSHQNTINRKQKSHTRKRVSFDHKEDLLSRFCRLRSINAFEEFWIKLFDCNNRLQ